jgi:hypothetical protein
MSSLTRKQEFILERLLAALDGLATPDLITMSNQLRVDAVDAKLDEKTKERLRFATKGAMAATRTM